MNMSIFRRSRVVVESQLWYNSSDVRYIEILSPAHHQYVQIQGEWILVQGKWCRRWIAHKDTHTQQTSRRLAVLRPPLWPPSPPHSCGRDAWNCRNNSTPTPITGHSTTLLRTQTLLYIYQIYLNCLLVLGYVNTAACRHAWASRHSCPTSNCRRLNGGVTNATIMTFLHHTPPADVGLITLSFYDRSQTNDSRCTLECYTCFTAWYVWGERLETISIP